MDQEVNSTFSSLPRRGHAHHVPRFRNVVLLTPVTGSVTNASCWKTISTGSRSAAILTRR